MAAWPNEYQRVYGFYIVSEAFVVCSRLVPGAEPTVTFELCGRERGMASSTFLTPTEGSSHVENVQ